MRETPTRFAEVSDDLVETARRIADLELESLYFDEYDEHPAILSVHAGAGGVDAQDWAEMMLRMYTRYLADIGLDHEIDDVQPGEEAGIKSATLTVEGTHAYAILEAERGVHRLVRISPFDSNSRRHTSFAGVDVVPLVEDARIEIDLEDLRVDYVPVPGRGWPARQYDRLGCAPDAPSDRGRGRLPGGAVPDPEQG